MWFPLTSTCSIFKTEKRFSFRKYIERTTIFGSWMVLILERNQQTGGNKLLDENRARGMDR